MDIRDTLLSARFLPAKEEPFVEADLRSLSGSRLLGHRGKLEFATKLAFKASDAFRQDQSAFRLWADIQAQGPDQVMLPDLGRAVIPDPVIFAPRSGDGTRRADPWTRAHDRLTLELDFQQLDEIERQRAGGSLTFVIKMGGVAYYGAKVGTLYPDNHTLMYQVGSSDWQQVLNQLGYGTYLNVEIPFVAPNGLTGPLGQAAESLQQSLTAFRRGDYEEAVADCRPGLDALEESDRGRFSLKPWSSDASKDQRLYRIQHSLRSLTHLAHHPNDPAVATDEAPTHARWSRADAEAVIGVLAALKRQRMG